MIDYGRGLPLTMLPFGIIFPYLFNTLDGKYARKQLEDFGDHVEVKPRTPQKRVSILPSAIITSPQDTQPAFWLKYCKTCTSG